MLHDILALCDKSGSILVNIQNTRTTHTQYIPWLCICAGFFIARVVAQLVQKFYHLSNLPPFNAWYSGALAYPWLLTSQILIIVSMIWIITGFIKKSTAPNPLWGMWLLALGYVYFVVMLFRIIAGFTFAVDHPWLGARIPALFHIVLASFVLLVGHFHYINGKNEDMHE